MFEEHLPNALHFHPPSLSGAYRSRSSELIAESTMYKLCLTSTNYGSYGFLGFCEAAPCAGECRHEPETEIDRAWLLQVALDKRPCLRRSPSSRTPGSCPLPCHLGGLWEPNNPMETGAANSQPRLADWLGHARYSDQ